MKLSDFISRRSSPLLLYPLLLGFSVITITTATEAPEKTVPNILFIAVDDLNIYNTVLGELPQNFLKEIYPDPATRKNVLERLTPNMDRLSSMGLTFENAFCASPLCGPSRTALLTGVPPHVSGYYHHDRHFRAYETLTYAVTLPEYLRKNGYFTTGLGKLFHKGRSYLDRGYFSDWPDQLYSWDKWIEVHSGTGRTRASTTAFKESASRYWEQGNLPAGHFTRFGSTTLPRSESNDYANAAFTKELLIHGSASIVDMRGEKQTVTLPKNQPFFIACGLFAPHLPWVVPESFLQQFPTHEMSITHELLHKIRRDTLDLSPTGLSKTKRTHFSRLLEYGKELDGKDGDLNAWKAIVQAYLATIAFSDQNIGILVNAIEQNPHRENTIVVLWSDHGYHVGDKMREGKTTLWEASNHCNLIWIDPTFPNARSGKRTLATVSLQDIYPTLISRAGLTRPNHVHGYDLSAIIEGTHKQGHPVLSTFEEGNHTLRTDRYRYLRFNNGDEELYDLEQDPLEYKNLIQTSNPPTELNQLRRMLEEELNKTPTDYFQELFNTRQNKHTEKQYID